MAWLSDREPGGEMREPMLEVCVFCLSDTGVWKEHGITGWKEDNKKGKMGGGHARHWKAPVLTNGVPPQRLYSTPVPLQVHFFARFCGMTQRCLCIIEWITKHWKPFSLVSAVVKWSLRSAGNVGNSMRPNLWYQSVLEINQVYSIYPKPNLSMSTPKKESKIYLFSDRHHFLKRN